MRIFWYRFTSTLRFVLIAIAVMLFLDQMSNFRMPTYLNIGYAAFIGFFLGMYYVVFGFYFIRKLPFILRILAQLLVVQLIIMFAALLIINVSEVLGSSLTEILYGPNLLSTELLPVYYKTQLYTFVLVFFFDLENILGKGFLFNYLRGKYDKPRKERRIFMFLDLVSSTRHAENMGDDAYYEFLNDCYRMLNKPVINTRAQVLKYVGDEAILTWTYNQGIAHNNCVEFYFSFQEALVHREAYFLHKYGVVPQFKAGLHEGVVVLAYLGDIRKQLDCSGDVMNTTSRIVNLCGQYDADLLISAQLYHALPSKQFIVSEIPDAVLKGKAVGMDLVNIIERKMEE